MGKYHDLLFNDKSVAADNSIDETSPASGKYSNMLFGTSISQGKPSFMEGVTSNVFPQDESGKMAGIGTQAVASLSKDIKERAAYFAKKRFPNDPNAIAKYGVQDGRLFYEDDDGKQYYEEPSAKLGQIGQLVASGVGEALPIAGSIAGSMIAAPLGGVPGAAAGAAAGDVARQGLAMGAGAQQEYSPLQTAGEAALGAVGQGVGVGVGKGLSRNAARDLARIQTPEAQAKIKALETSSKHYDYPLTGGEKTGLQSLVNQENLLGSLSESGQDMRNFYVNRTETNAPKATGIALSDISPVTSREVGAKQFQEGAKATIAAETTVRQKAAAPLYESSRHMPIPDTEYQGLLKDPFLKKQIEAVKNSAKYQSDISDLFPVAGKTVDTSLIDESGSAITRKMPPIEAKIGYLDVVKKRIDGMIESAQNSGNKNDVRIYRNAKEKLLNVLDTASPEYKQARAIFEEGSPAVTELTKGEVGVAAGKKPTQLLTAPTSIFYAGPEAIAKNRAAFVKAGQEDAWNAGVRAHLDNVFTKAHSEKTLTPESNYRDALLAKGGKEKIQAALTREQWGNFNNFMDVLEASGRVPKGGSRTAFAQEGIAGMKKEASGVVGKVLRATNPTNILDTNRIANWYGEFMLGKHASELAAITTSPDNLTKLKQLRGISPRSKKAINIVSQIVNKESADTISKPSNAKAGELAQ